MSPEEMAVEIDRLRAELAEEREERKRMGRALEDAMAAVRASADDRKALEARRTADRERKAAQYRRRISRDLQATVSRETHVTTPSPSLPPPSSSPSLSAPISPPPISSPNPSSPPQASLLSVEQSKEGPADLQALWNAEADPHLPRWRDMTEKRRKAAAARLKERSLAEWRLILGRINGSPFCLGVNDRGWKADVEFFLRPETATRALEGKYDPKPGQALPGKRIDPNSDEWVEA